MAKDFLSLSTWEASLEFRAPGSDEPPPREEATKAARASTVSLEQF